MAGKISGNSVCTQKIICMFQVPLYATPEYARYDKLLKCLRLVGKANVPAVFDALWAWRARMEERLSGVVDTISIQCRRVGRQLLLFP